MLKAGAKRRMTRAECEEKKRIDADKDAALKEKLQEISKLKKDLAEKQVTEEKLANH
jgi:hypothetical protein